MVGPIRIDDAVIDLLARVRAGVWRVLSLDEALAEAEYAAELEAL